MIKSIMISFYELSQIFVKIQSYLIRLPVLQQSNSKKRVSEFHHICCFYTYDYDYES